MSSYSYYSFTIDSTKQKELAEKEGMEWRAWREKARENPQDYPDVLELITIRKAVTEDEIRTARKFSEPVY